MKGNLVTYRQLFVSVFLLCIQCFCVTTIFSQQHNLSNIRERTIHLTNQLDTLQLDTLSIVPKSFRIIHDTISSSKYKIDVATARFIEITDIQKRELRIQYRVYPFLLSKKTKAIEEYVFDNQGAITEEYVVKDIHEELFEFGKLDVTGGLGRSLNFGNNQNLVVNSNLNLRMAGELSNGIEIVGVLTDENLPFEPQGTSRQIRDLDNVFLQFLKDDHQITLGDYEQPPPDSYFLKFNKRLQGINYSGQFFQNNEWKATAQVSGAVARGQYARNEFLGKEGNQGPYKLYGANNESFIIILAGTERVFIDGLQLQRGRDYDYTIDYNTGEIRFTSKQFITNRSRISVEFEYKTQTYNTTFFNTEATYGNQELNFQLNLYSQQDAKRSASFLNDNLNSQDFFSQSGDNSDNFFVDSFYETEYSESQRLYKMIVDTVINGTNFEKVFVASTSPSDTLYHVTFTFVGQGNGNYQVKNSLVNGRLYEFVNPINGQAQGSYVAKEKISPPSQQQMVSLQTTYQPKENQLFTLETAFSNKDINTFSTLGNNDNKGFAGKFIWKSKYSLSSDSLKNKLITEVNYEIKQSQFRPIERYRPAEFSRDWNLDSNNTDSLQEQYGNIIFQFIPSNKQSIKYQLSTFFQENDYSGIKHIGEYNYNSNGYSVFAKLDYLRAKELETIESSFLRPSILVSKKLQFLNGTKLGFRYDENKREFTNVETGLLDLQSIGDRDIRVFVESEDTSTVYTKFSVGKHYDFGPLESELTPLFEANVLEVNGRLNKLANQQLSWNFTYRDLEVENINLTEESDKKSFLGKMNYSAQFFGGAISTGFDYELGSGQEPKREFSYLQVSNGEGHYTWIDYNENGMQEITEFEVAPFVDQANFVRVYTTTNEYINAESVRLNQWINLNPAVQWKNSDGIKKIISKLSVNSILSTNRRVYENASASQFNPYLFSVNNDGLIAASNQISNKVVYNKLSNKFRLVFVNQSRQQKNQLLSGFEERKLTSNKLTANLYFKNQISVQTLFGVEQQGFFAENYDLKNFNFTSYSIQPRLNWIVNNSLRIGGDYLFKKSENDQLFGGEEAINHALQFDIHYNKLKRFSLQGKFSFNNITFTGDPTSAVQFSMLNGLQNGKNILWNLNFEREVAKAVKINLIYDGRNLGDSNPVHTGRARVTALFN